MRLFIGSFAILDDYKELKNSFSFCEGKWVEQKNLHLTFAFLGEHKTATHIKEQLQDLTYPKVDIPIKGVGFFGHPPKVLYAKVNSPHLEKLYNEITTRLKLQNNKPFIPHITLCRIKRVRNFHRFIQHIKANEDKKLGTLPLNLVLIESLLTPKYPIYKTIYHIGEKR